MCPADAASPPHYGEASRAEQSRAVLGLAGLRSFDSAPKFLARTAHRNRLAELDLFKTTPLAFLGLTLTYLKSSCPAFCRPRWVVRARAASDRFIAVKLAVATSLSAKLTVSTSYPTLTLTVALTESCIWIGCHGVRCTSAVRSNNPATAFACCELELAARVVCTHLHFKGLL